MPTGPAIATDQRPVIGITADLADARHRVGVGYSAMIAAAGGTPVILPPVTERLDAYLALCDGFVLSGGDDPDMAQWGVPTHPDAAPIHPDRQRFETTLLAALDGRPATPVFGVCLGMQLMALHAGGTLDQHLPDTLPTHAMHWGRTPHRIEGDLGSGEVHSHHRQAIVDPGRLCIAATAPDGVIEAVRDDARPFYLGVQWHPERTADERFGPALFHGLVHAAQRHATTRPHAE